jgi:hypothetical protein
MGKVNAWIMDMQESVHAAIDAECDNIQQVIGFVKQDPDVEIVDENFVKEYYNELMENM